MNFFHVVYRCSSGIDLLPDFIETGFDMLNPVQCSATGMDPLTLKDRFGDEIVPFCANHEER